MMHPRSQWLTWPTLRRGLVLPAAGLALFAEHLVADLRGQTQGAGSPPAAAWDLFILAAILFAVATWPVPALHPGTAPPPWRTWRMLRRPAWFLAPLGLAVLCALGAVPLFLAVITTPPDKIPAEPANTGAWLLWIAALLLFGAAFVAWERQAPASLEGAPAGPAGDRLPQRVEWLVMAGLGAAALLLRLPNLDTVPPGLWFDEAQNGLVAQSLLAPGAAHPPFILNLTQMGALPFYILGLVLKFFGPTVWPLRLLPALSGSALAPLVYLLGARLYGWRAGLAAAGLLTVSAWNITFSRFGMVSLVTVALDVAVYLCAAQAIRSGRLGYFAGTGVLLGLALQMYYVARLVPIVLVLVLAHQVITTRGRLLRALGGGILVCALGAILAFLPVVLFSLQKPADFGGRVSQVSVFNPENTGGDPNAMRTNVIKHALMFNCAGDLNPRHNLPGAPMLDDLTAALFIVGLGLCVLRAWRWQYFFPVAWFGASIAGGILSLPFEAPQSHRTLENSVVTAALAGIVLGEFWQMLTRPVGAAPASAPAAAGAPGGAGRAFWRPSRAARPRTTLPTRKHPAPVVNTPAPGAGPRAPWVRWAIGGAGILAFVALVASTTIPRYFSVQAQTRDVWNEMYAPQLETARVLRDAAPADDVYISAVLMDLPPQHYLAPNANGQEWPGIGAIPLAAAPGHNLVLVLDPRDAADISTLVQIYPHATFQLLRAPASPDPLLYTVRIPAEDIAGLQGVRASRYDAGATTPREDASQPNFQYDWAQAGGKPGTLRLAATLRVDAFGTYAFDWQPAGPVQPDALAVDGYPVLPGGRLPLAIGLHSIVATDTE